MDVRNYSLFLVLVTSFFYVPSVFGRTLTLTPEVQYVTEGEDFSLTCTVEETLKSGLGETMMFLKRQSPEGKPIVVSIGNIGMDSTYINRVAASPIANPDGHATGYNIRISQAAPHDSGEFGCAFAVGVAQQGEPVWRPVYIKKQIQSLEMFAVAPNGTKYLLENGAAYQLTKKESLRLMCLASGSVPEADVSVVLGLQDIKGQEFDKTSERVLVQEGTNHMSIYAYNTSIISKEPFIVEVPQTVSCKASVEGFDEEKLVTITTLFKHAPIIKCDSTIAVETKMDVPLVCYLSADPPASKVIWRVKLASGKNLTIDGTEKDQTYSQETDHKGNLTVSTLYISQVFKNHFYNEYFIIAENSEGVSQMEAILERDPNAGKITGSASCAAASLLLLTITAILRLL